MARAELFVPEPVAPPSPTVVLQLSLDEAKALVSLTGNVCGDSKGKRALTASVYQALRDAGVYGFGYDAMTRSTSFKDEA